MENNENIFNRKKAYVIVGYNPKNGEVAAYQSRALYDAALNYASYIIPEWGYYNKSSNQKGPNQKEWFELRTRMSWVKAKWPNFQWKVYRANSKYCPIEIDLTEVYEAQRSRDIKKLKKVFSLPFKVKKNWDWSKKP